MSKRGIGNWGEEQACQYLQRHAFLILERNYYTRFGELDIIAYDTSFEQLVFCEVKTRFHAIGEYAISRRKYQNLYKSAWIYMKRESKITDDFRFDSIAIMLKKGKGNAVLRHHKAISQFL